MIMPCYAVLERIDGRLFEAASDLGAGPFRLLWHILLPLSARGLIVGALFVFILSMGSYATPALLGGNQRHARWAADSGAIPRSRQSALLGLRHVAGDHRDHAGLGDADLAPLPPARPQFVMDIAPAMCRRVDLGNLALGGLTAILLVVPVCADHRHRRLSFNHSTSPPSTAWIELPVVRPGVSG